MFFALIDRGERATMRTIGSWLISWKQLYSARFIFPFLDMLFRRPIGRGVRPEVKSVIVYHGPVGSVWVDFDMGSRYSLGIFVHDSRAVIPGGIKALSQHNRC